MRIDWRNFDRVTHAAFRAAIAFLEGRLESRDTVNWALRLKPKDVSRRCALLVLIDDPRGRQIAEPWRSAWRLIEESWEDEDVDDPHGRLDAYQAKFRLEAGDRSGSLIGAIVRCVAARLLIAPFSDLQLSTRKPPRRPKKVEDLFHASLTSGDLVDPALLRIPELIDLPFLTSLGLALDGGVLHGLEIGRRIGWKEELGSWRLGQLNRVYFVPDAQRENSDHEPDQFHRGIAPSVKLLSAVVARLAELDARTASEFARRWKATNSSVHLRLWAALARDARVVSAVDVASTLVTADEQVFWNLHNYPEIAELRAVRFGEFDQVTRAALFDRIRALPPRSMWPKKAEGDRVATARVYWAVRELRRIEVGGFTLPAGDKAWLEENSVSFDDVISMRRIDYGFMGTTKARPVPTNPDPRYDALIGVERLRALEAALTSVRRQWDDDPADRANDWIRQTGNALAILDDLESTEDGGNSFVQVWNRFGWAHKPPEAPVAERDLDEESRRVLRLLTMLHDATLRGAIEGIAHWLHVWDDYILDSPDGMRVWVSLWPIAVEVENGRAPPEEAPPINSVGVPQRTDRDPHDLDTLNTPVGKLVGVFLTTCPSIVGQGEQPFQEGNTQRTMRDELQTALGTAGSIVRYRLIEHMPYFMVADREWTIENLVRPLLVDSAESFTLWRAVVRQRFSQIVMSVLGTAMAERAADARLSRDTRKSLVFRVVVDCLHAFKEQRPPSVERTRIPQMLRSVEDEVRAEGAEAIHRFIRDVPRPDDPQGSTPEGLFDQAARPLLQEVWPQERSLATPGVSRALAELPAAAPGRFAEAVEVIARFLVPFECWSLLDYGLYGEDNGTPRLSIVNDQAKAVALLELLDMTVGTSEGSVVPHDLPDALDHMRRIDPSLEEASAFRRLAVLARRYAGRT